MAGDWIKIEHWTPDKPEVFQMADSLQIDPDAVTGKLIRVWIWADQQTVNGNAPSVTLSLLDRVSGVAGFAQQMIHVGWLTKDGSGFAFANFDRHNGETAKTRALSAKRTARHRTRGAEVTNMQRKCNDDVTLGALPREEKRREENIKETQDADASAATQRKRKRFEKPTPVQVQEYAAEAGIQINATAFCDYYEANGWRVGRNAMKDWQAAARGWAARENGHFRGPSSPQPRKGGFRMLDEV